MTKKRNKNNNKLYKRRRRGGAGPMWSFLQGTQNVKLRTACWSVISARFLDSATWRCNTGQLRLQLFVGVHWWCQRRLTVDNVDPRCAIPGQLGNKIRANGNTIIGNPACKPSADHDGWCRLAQSAARCGRPHSAFPISCHVLARPCDASWVWQRGREVSAVYSRSISIKDEIDDGKFRTSQPASWRPQSTVVDDATAAAQLLTTGRNFGKNESINSPEQKPNILMSNSMLMRHDSLFGISLTFFKQSYQLYSQQ